MFEYGGKNDFGERFDFFEWTAPYYETPKEVYIALAGLNLNGKTLKSINAIGSCRGVGSKQSLYRIIRQAGIDLEDNWEKTYKHIDKVLVPWELHSCEPLQFAFEDGTSLEILPIEEGGARIGINSIPVGLVDGLNRSNVDMNIFFRELLGRRLSDTNLYVETISTKTINGYTFKRNGGEARIRKEYKIEFSFEGAHKLTLSANSYSWYRIAATGDFWETLGQPDRIPFKRKKESVKEYEQGEIEITNGIDCGGVFLINATSKNDVIEFTDLDCFCISIDDVDVETYLAHFLYKYYDPEIQRELDWEDPGFDWHDNNLYSFDDMKRILADIREVIKLLREDYDNPVLKPVKAYWVVSNRDISEEETNNLRRQKVLEAVDFYERFCNRIEKMMKLPGTDIMSFTGP